MLPLDSLDGSDLKSYLTKLQTNKGKDYVDAGHIRFGLLMHVFALYRYEQKLLKVRKNSEKKKHKLIFLLL